MKLYVEIFKLHEPGFLKQVFINQINRSPAVKKFKIPGRKSGRNIDRILAGSPL